MADDDELQAYLESLSDEIRAPIAAAVQEQAQLLSDAQKQALQALQQSPDETGNLEASCKAVPGDNDLEWIVQAGGDLTMGEVRGSSGVEFDYAEAFEYGTSHQRARPFFWPTYRERRDGIEQAIQESIDEALR